MTVHLHPAASSGKSLTERIEPNPGRPVPHALLRRAAVRATRAPSVHNTQPWTLAVRGTALEVHADWDRRVPIFDPQGRQLMMSCGAAVLNARAALANTIGTPIVRRFPDADRPALVARIELSSPAAAPDSYLAELDRLTESRRTNRRPFLDRAVASSALDVLVAAARAEDADLVAVRSSRSRKVLQALRVAANERKLVDLTYRAELRAWNAYATEGHDVQTAHPLSPAAGDASDSIESDPLIGPGLPVAPEGPEACLVLTTEGDRPRDWARAGEALERVLLEATLRGLAVSLEAAVIEVAETRTALRRELGLRSNPQLLLRVGYAEPSAATRRRRLVDVLTGVS